MLSLARMTLTCIFLLIPLILDSFAHPLTSLSPDALDFSQRAALVADQYTQLEKRSTVQGVKIPSTKAAAEKMIRDANAARQALISHRQGLNRLSAQALSTAQDDYHHARRVRDTLMQMDESGSYTYKKYIRKSEGDLHLYRELPQMSWLDFDPMALKAL